MGYRPPNPPVPLYPKPTRVELLYADLRRMDDYLADALDEPWRREQAWFEGEPLLDHWIRR